MGWDRETYSLNQSNINWQAFLWRYLVKAPYDYAGFDRRFIYKGLYLEELEGDKLSVFVAVDTSGSISQVEMTEFLSEVQAILRLYPQIECRLYFADSSIYGPYDLNANDCIPKPKGGGGTSFYPFINILKDRNQNSNNSIAIYLTDGFAEFPKEIFSIPILWVISSGGIDLNEIPYGESVRILKSN